MDLRPLGLTDIRVSALALGTRTWGEQNSEADAHAPLDRAVAAGINLVDAAEMYPVPPRAETQGRTEAYLGSWLAQPGRRRRVVLATKVIGRGRTGFAHIRGGGRLDRANIRAAIEGSLARLRTDHVDLYQVHWPDRVTDDLPALGRPRTADQEGVPIEETLAALGELVGEGKVRAIGLSNETPWGVMKFLDAAQRLGLPRIVSIQNRYNLISRVFDEQLGEVAIRENVGLLAFSPLCMGVLSGKYLGGQRPAGARITLFENRFGRYVGPRAEAPTRRYVELARDHGLEPAALALAFVIGRPFTTSTIVGATTIPQLDTAIRTADLALSTDVLAGIAAIHADNANPCP